VHSAFCYVKILLNPVIYCLGLLKFLIRIKGGCRQVSEKRQIVCAQYSMSCKNENNENVNSGGRYSLVVKED
jgi:hypothetical protein